MCIVCEMFAFETTTDYNSKTYCAPLKGFPAQLDKTHRMGYATCVISAWYMWFRKDRKCYIYDACESFVLSFIYGGRASWLTSTIIALHQCFSNIKYIKDK